MPRYIDADELCASALEPELWDGLNNQCTMLNLVNAAPTADVAPVRRGEWKIGYKSGTRIFDGAVCSLCDCWSGEKGNFCSRCGADMREENPDGR